MTLPRASLPSPTSEVPMRNLKPNTLTEVIAPGLRLGLSLHLPLMALFACQFPLKPEHYTFTETDSGTLATAPPSDPGSSRHADDDLFELLGGEADCVNDLHKACSAEIDTCSASKACKALSDCVLELQYPGALAECASTLAMPSPTSVLHDFEMMRDCWVARAHKCTVGDNFECVGNYTAPPVAHKKSLHVEQRFQYLGPSAEIQDEVFTLYACNFGDGCARPLSTSRSSTDGWAELDVPLTLGTASQNWTGNRLVTGSYVRPSRLERNIPLWFDHVELTLLMEETMVQAVKKEGERALGGVAAELGLPSSYASIEDQAVFVQVLDCLGNPAPDITITSSTLTPTVYLDGDNHRLAFERSTTFRDGAASVFDLPPDTDVTLRAFRGDRQVSTWTGRLAAHDVIYLKMFPSRGE